MIERIFMAEIGPQAHYPDGRIKDAITAICKATYMAFYQMRRLGYFSSGS